MTSSHLTQFIVQKLNTSHSDSRGSCTEQRGIFFLQPSEQKGNKLKAVESYSSESYSTFYSWHSTVEPWKQLQCCALRAVTAVSCLVTTDAVSRDL